MAFSRVASRPTAATRKLGRSTPRTSQPPLEFSSATHWQIARPPDEVTWTEIHERADTLSGGVAHAKVLARKKGAPVWEVEPVCAHLGIAPAALQRSVLRLYKTRSAYPEACHQWKADEQKRGAMVDSPSIQNFLAHRQPPDDSPSCPAK